MEILVADTVPANMSLSISDADMNSESSSNTIVSNFLLKGDLKGYIHNPAFYLLIRLRRKEVQKLFRFLGYYFEYVRTGFHSRCFAKAIILNIIS